MIYLCWGWWWWLWWWWWWRWPVAIWERWRPELTKFTQRPVTLPSLYSLLQKSSRRHDSMQGSFGSSGINVTPGPKKNCKKHQETKKSQAKMMFDDVWLGNLLRIWDDLVSPIVLVKPFFYCFNRSDVFVALLRATALIPNLRKTLLKIAAIGGMET
jgi:hypothetical protein